MGESGPPAERRTGERYLACFPAAVERPDGAMRPSVIRDLSETGALLLIRTRIAVGDEVKLQLYIQADPNAFTAATGRVVRVEEVLGEAGPWSQRVAVQFTDPLAVHADQVRRFREVAQRLGMA
jgi:hypothetical protein